MRLFTQGLLQKTLLGSNNPVKDMIVEKPEDYLYSSARNYADMHGLLDIVMETRKVKSF